VQSFQKGYGEIGFIMGVSSFGRLTATVENEDGDVFDGDDPPQFKVRIKPTPGVRFAGYAAPSSHFHIGGYVAIRKGVAKKPDPENETADRYDYYLDKPSDVLFTSLGLATKLGGQAARRLWVGFGLDVGVDFMKIDKLESSDPLEYDESTMIGLELFPKIEFDIIAVDTGKFKLEIPISVGAVIIPVSGRTVMDPDDDNGQTECKFRVWSITPALTVGVAFGG